MEYIWAFFKYFNAWLLMGFVLAAAVAAEKIYIIFTVIISRKTLREVGVPLIKNVRGAFRLEVGLPESASVNIALYGPALAFAALMTVCASIPFSTFIPIIDNGADVIQILQFMLLSEVLALISLYALGTKQAENAARIEMGKVIRLAVPVVACFASLAAFLIKNGLDSDPFSLNSFSIAGQLTAMSRWGICGTTLFIFTILSQIPHRDFMTGCALLKQGEIPEYTGAPRGILQVWAVFRSFIIVALVTYMFFPSNFIATINNAVGISWRSQALNFVIFWFSVVIMRTVAVPVCWLLLDLLKARLPKPLRETFLVTAFTACAMLLLYYECILLSQEAAAF